MEGQNQQGWGNNSEQEYWWLLACCDRRPLKAAVMTILPNGSKKNRSPTAPASLCNNVTEHEI